MIGLIKYLSILFCLLRPRVTVQFFGLVVVSDYLLSGVSTPKQGENILLEIFVLNINVNYRRITRKILNNTLPTLHMDGKNIFIKTCYR